MTYLTVILPTYNRLDRLQKVLAALATQTYPDFEVIVVSDGSTDGTDAYLRGLAAGTGPLAAGGEPLAVSSLQSLSLSVSQSLSLPVSNLPPPPPPPLPTQPGRRGHPQSRPARGNRGVGAVY
ncbi:MAG: glycosyltransferase [Chloroflexi bacterium]|nr:glycosyltransferase [Chloroflexota bacterium]